MAIIFLGNIVPLHPWPEGAALPYGCSFNRILVSQRIHRFANLVGRENIIAGAGCDFDDRSHPRHGGYYLSFRGLKVDTEQEGLVQAVADRILPIIE